jgi:hypothetical protein
MDGKSGLMPGSSHGWPGTSMVPDFACLRWTMFIFTWTGRVLPNEHCKLVGDFRATP